MANYKETNITGTQYQRCWRVNIENPLDQGKVITFHEEKITILDGGNVKQHLGALNETLTVENSGTEFSLLNPETGEALVEGASMTYETLYVALYSLYMHLAQERDNGIAAEEPTA